MPRCLVCRSSGLQFRFMKLPLSVIAVLLVLALPSTSEAQRCDRQCLADFITTYLEAMVAHDPERLHTSSRVRFTEDTVEMRLGQGGLWKTAHRAASVSSGLSRRP